jgi:hypothetical protein
MLLVHSRQTQLIRWFGLGAEKKVYVSAYLQDISELDTLIRFTKDKLGTNDSRTLKQMTKRLSALC